MPASAIAAATAFVVSVSCAFRPISSGRKLRVWAMPILSRLPAGAFCATPLSDSLRVKTVICGLSTPSVPPDMTKAIRSSTRIGSGSARYGASATESAEPAYSRVKSFTPPLPSVLPRIARIDAGSIRPASINRVRPETSPGPLVGIRITSTEMARAVIRIRRFALRF